MLLKRASLASSHNGSVEREAGVVQLLLGSIQDERSIRKFVVVRQLHPQALRVRLLDRHTCEKE